MKGIQQNDLDYSWDPSGPRIFGRWSIQRLGQKSDADSRSLESNRCAIETSE